MDDSTIVPPWRDLPYEERMVWIANSALFWIDWIDFQLA